MKISIYCTLHYTYSDIVKLNLPFKIVTCKYSILPYNYNAWLNLLLQTHAHTYIYVAMDKHTHTHTHPTEAEVIVIVKLATGPFSK